MMKGTENRTLENPTSWDDLLQVIFKTKKEQKSCPSPVKIGKVRGHRTIFWSHPSGNDTGTRGNNEDPHDTVTLFLLRKPK